MKGLWASALLALTLATGCGEWQAGRSVAVGAWQQTREIVVLAPSGPTTLFVDATGVHAGFEYDLVNEFASRHGLKLRFVPATSRAEAQARLRRGEAHLAAGVWRSEDEGDVFGPVYQKVEPVLVHAPEVSGDVLTQLQGASVTYRIATGPQQGRKVFTLQTLPGRENQADTNSRVANYAGFSLHAGVMAEAHQRDKLERLCRYISRPAISEKRLALTANGQIRYELKTPYRNGTTHVIFEPLDFIAKLAALVPKPRVNLTRFHGLFAPNSKHRVQVTPAKRGKKPDQSEGLDTGWCDKSPAERHRAMTWMQRLKRVFNIDIEVCEDRKSVV